MLSIDSEQIGTTPPLLGRARARDRSTDPRHISAGNESRLEPERPIVVVVPMAPNRSPNFITRRRLLQLLATSGFLISTRSASAQNGRAANTKRRLYIQPLGGGLSAGAVETTQRALEAFYPLQVVALAAVDLPREAFYAPRQRYRAEKLLNHLEALAPTDAYRVLGLTGADISTTKGRHADWGILGLATIDGKACVLSSFRCKKPGTTDDQARFRLGKTAVHEIGHTLGLEHCPTYGCLMEDARGTVTTTDREYDLCPLCRRTLIDFGREAKAIAAPPWPRPNTR